MVGNGKEGIGAGISGWGGGNEGSRGCLTLDWYIVDGGGKVLIARWGLD